MNIMSESLGSRLKQLREERAWTQAQVAQQINVARSSYAHYENDTRTPDKATLIYLAEVFRVSTDYLLGRSNIRQTAEHFLKQQYPSGQSKGAVQVAEDKTKD